MTGVRSGQVDMDDIIIFIFLYCIEILTLILYHSNMLSNSVTQNTNKHPESDNRDMKFFRKLIVIQLTTIRVWNIINCIETKYRHIFTNKPFTTFAYIRLKNVLANCSRVCFNIMHSCLKRVKCCYHDWTVGLETLRADRVFQILTPSVSWVPQFTYCNIMLNPK